MWTIYHSLFLLQHLQILFLASSQTNPTLFITQPPPESLNNYWSITNITEAASGVIHYLAKTNKTSLTLSCEAPYPISIIIQGYIVISLNTIPTELKKLR